MSRFTFRALLALVALALMAALPVVASAKRQSSGAAKAKKADRNRDGLPDRWERRHRLSLRVKQASRDQDRDGSNNAAEYAANTNPRDRDSDDDGVKDGDENVGTVTSYADGVLVISSGGLPVSGRVTSDTEIRCGACGRDGRRHHGDDDDQHGFASHRDGDDDVQDERSGDDDGPFHEHHGTAGGMPTAGGLPTAGGMPTGGGLPTRRVCTVDDLKPGTIVREAELKLTASGPVWDEIKIVPPAAT